MSHAADPRPSSPLEPTPAAAPTTAGRATVPAAPLHRTATTPIDGASGPCPPPELRPGARVAPGALRRDGDAAVKENTFRSASGYPSGRAHWQTQLHATVIATAGADAPTRVWADVHVAGHDGELVVHETLPLVAAGKDGEGNARFELHHPIYEGGTATPGSVERRADVRRVAYRIYGARDAEVVTDGLVHECTLRSDVVSP